MPRRNRTPGVGREPGRLYALEEELHATWNYYNRQRLAREEQAATQHRYDQLRNKLTRDRTP